MRTSLMLTLSLLHLARGDDFSVVRERVLETSIWPAPSSLPALASTANATAHALNASCLWPDINYEDQTRANWQAIIHLNRVQAIVLAATTPGSPSFESAFLMERLHCSLDAWIFRFPVFTNPNWWYAVVGEEERLQTIFLALGLNRTTPEEQLALTRFSYNSSWWINDYGGGDNLSDMLNVELLRGLATLNETAVAEAFAVLWSTSIIQHVTTPGAEGVIDDLSYHFHGIQMLASAYGAGWAQTMLQKRAIAYNTRWALPATNTAVLAAFLAEGDFAITFGRKWDWGTTGRGIDRPGTTFGWPFAAADLTNLSGEVSAAPWKETLLEFSNALNGNSAPQPPSSKLFWTVDFYAHKRPSWGAAWKGHGANGLWAVVGDECDNSENLKGELTASGALNIYASAEPDNAVESYANIFPLWNWTTIAGVTAEQRKTEPCSSASGDQWKVRNTVFVGGASDGRSGAIAHDTAQPVDLTAQRAFFFFDDSVLMLGRNITAPSLLPVRTAFLTRLLPDPRHDDRGVVSLTFSNGTTSTLADGSSPSIFSAGVLAYISAGGIVALVDNSNPVGVQVGTETGNFNSIGPFNGQVSGRMLTAFYEHGVVTSPPASFSVTLAPNVSSSAASATAAARAGVACISNTDAVQAAGEPTGGLIAAVVWSVTGGSFTCAAPFPPDATPLSVSADRDIVVLVRANATHFVVSAAHPAASAAGATVRVTVNRAGDRSSACDPLASNGTVVMLALPSTGALVGSTVSVACALA